MTYRLYSVGTHVGEQLGSGFFRLELEDVSAETVVEFVNNHRRAQHATNYTTWLETPEFPTNEYIEDYRRHLEEEYHTAEEIARLVETYAAERIREPTFPGFEELGWNGVCEKFHAHSLEWVRVIDGAPVADEHDIYYQWYTQDICFVIVDHSLTG